MFHSNWVISDYHSFVWQFEFPWLNLTNCPTPVTSVRIINPMIEDTQRMKTKKRQETWLQRQLQSVNHSSSGWFVAGMCICGSLLGTELEQVVLSVLVSLSLLVLVILLQGFVESSKIHLDHVVVILYIMMSLAIFRRLRRDVYPRWFSRLVTLVVRLYRFSTKRADLRCRTTSFRKCHILKPENPSPSLYSNPQSSIDGRPAKQTC